MNIDLIHTGLIHGLVLSLVALGVMIPFRFLNFPDLSAEGGYPLGGAITAVLLSSSTPMPFCVALSMLASALLGLATALIARKLAVPSLLAGIIVSTMAYSVNLRLMGKPNIALFQEASFEWGLSELTLVVAISALLLTLFLYTDYGLRLRSIGAGPEFAKRSGFGLTLYTCLGLAISGGLFGLAGSLSVQIAQFMDIGIGAGMLIHGLASVMIGEALIGRENTFKQIASPIIGALSYQQVQGLSLSLGLAPSDLKFFTGSIVLLVLMIRSQDHKDSAFI